MRISVRINSIAAQAQLRRWGGEYRDKVKQIVFRSLTKEAVTLRQDIHNHIAANLIIVRKSFLKSFKAKVLYKDKKRLPALHVGSPIKWAGIHEHGGIIIDKMLIPLYGRVGRKRFKNQIAELMRGGNTFFVKTNKGTVVLMAKSIKEHNQILSSYRRRYRVAENIKRLKRGANIPIAVLVQRVVIKKRLNIERMVIERIPRIATLIEKQLRLVR